MKYLPVVLIFLFISCETNAPQIKKESKIENDTIYDIVKGELVHEENDSLWFEPYEKRIPKVRRIFKKGKN